MSDDAITRSIASSVIRSVTYEADATLTVRLHRGSAYRYFLVPRTVFHSGKPTRCRRVVPCAEVGAREIGRRVWSRPPGQPDSGAWRSSRAADGRLLSICAEIDYGGSVAPRVYLETSVISYLVGRLSRDLLIVANQELTREWWASRRADYALFVSEIVLAEAALGDPEVAHQRLARTEGLPLLAVTVEAEQLAPRLQQAAGLAPQAATDALHMALAAVHGMDYLLSWNCRHIANATIRRAIERACRAAGYEPPVICTPQELSDQ